MIKTDAQARPAMKSGATLAGRDNSKLKAAQHALDSLFADISVPQEETMRLLERLREDIGIKIGVLKAELSHFRVER